MSNPIDMITASGHEVSFLCPEQTIIDFNDLKVHTQNICRYNGAIQWRLVQHLYLCALLAKLYYANTIQNSIQIAGYAASHDLHEIYVGDMVSGLKKYVKEFTEIENAWEEVVHETIGLPYSEKPRREVKFIDLRALAIEMYMLKHPAAYRVMNQFGGKILKGEENCFRQVQTATLDQAWEEVLSAIFAATNNRED